MTMYHTKNTCFRKESVSESNNSNLMRGYCMVVNLRRNSFIIRIVKKSYHDEKTSLTS